MSLTTDLEMAYHMGYDDALARRKPDASKAQVLASYDLAAENAKLRELLGGVGHLLFSLDVDYCVACPRDSISHPCPVYTIKGGECLYKSDMRELGVEVD